MTSLLVGHDYRICTRCVMDTTDPDISFDADGRCNHCRDFFARSQARKSAERLESELHATVERIRKAGRGKDYDCVVGLSGGCDSSFAAFKVVDLGLRPLLLHFDSGWNSETSVANIERVVDYLGLDLMTIVCDWEEMRGLQAAFFKAGMVNCDVPQDHAFMSALSDACKTNSISYWISGHDPWGSEGILAPAWRGHSSNDWRELKDINRKNGGTPLRHYPHRSALQQLLLDPYLHRIRRIPLYDLMPYSKTQAQEFLEREIGWRDYSGKHNESILTRFFQGHYLPEKFGYDKRRAHLSSLVVAGDISRDTALAELERPFYTEIELANDKAFVLKKLGISDSEWEELMKTPSAESRYRRSQILFDRYYQLRGKAGNLKRSLERAES